MEIQLEAARQCPGPKPEVNRLRGDIWLGVAKKEPGPPPSFTLTVPEPALVMSLTLPDGVAPLTKSGTLPHGRMHVAGAGWHQLKTEGTPCLIICMAVSRLMAILHTDLDSLPATAKTLLLSGGSGENNAFALLSPEQIFAGCYLLDCPYEGAVRNLVLKSKVLELVALFFGQLAGREKADCPYAPLTGHGTKLMARARSLLLSDIENPPSISQLARNVGISETGLKRQFKALFGLAPYEYLRKERMVRARELILKKNASVGEAALSVGYSNVSHFIDAFSRHYGVRPGALRSRRT